MTEAPEQRCGGCGISHVQTGLFFIPGGWEWPDGDLRDDYRQSLCQACGQGDQRYLRQFSRHFPNLRVVTDSDSAEAADRLDSGQP